MVALTPEQRVFDHYRVTFWRKGIVQVEVPLPNGTDPTQVTPAEWLAAVDRQHRKQRGEKQFVRWGRSR